jgi:hypothetical protein
VGQDTRERSQDREVGNQREESGQRGRRPERGDRIERQETRELSQDGGRRQGSHDKRGVMANEPEKRGRSFETCQ